MWVLTISGGVASSTSNTRSLTHALVTIMHINVTLVQDTIFQTSHFLLVRHQNHVHVHVEVLMIQMSTC